MGYSVVKNEIHISKMTLTLKTSRFIVGQIHEGIHIGGSYGAGGEAATNYNPISP